MSFFHEQEHITNRELEIARARGGRNPDICMALYSWLVVQFGTKGNPFVPVGATNWD